MSADTCRSLLCPCWQMQKGPPSSNAVVSFVPRHCLLSLSSHSFSGLVQGCSRKAMSLAVSLRYTYMRCHLDLGTSLLQ